MKKRKLLVLGLSTLTLVISSVGFLGFRAYADENDSNSGIYRTEESDSNSDDSITTYASVKKMKFILKIAKRDGKTETIDLKEHDYETTPNYYYTFAADVLNEKKAVVERAESNDDTTCTLFAREAGQLIVKDATKRTVTQIDYKVDTPKSGGIQTVTYTLPEIDETEYFYKKNLDDGTEEELVYDAQNRATVLKGDARFKDTVVTIYSAGKKGLAETIKPTKKDYQNIEGHIPTLEELLSCLIFNDDDKLFVRTDLSIIAKDDEDKLKEAAKPGEYHIDVLVKFRDNSGTAYTITIKTKANPKKSDDSTEHKNNAKPDSSTKPDGGAKPENNAKPDSNTNTNNSSNSGNSKNSGGGSSSRGGSGGSSGSSSRGGSGSRGGLGSSGRLTKTSTSSTLPSYVVKGGIWSNNNGHWQYKAGNTVYKDMWAAIENPFANEKLGQAKFSWFRFDKDGNMLTNWQWIKDEKDGKVKCYYLNSISNGNLGAMLANTTTPDGYTVNASGEWVINGIVQTK